jgi:hypothetical protein
MLRARKPKPEFPWRETGEVRPRAPDIRLAFLYQHEASVEGLPLLRLELLGAYWFRRIWHGYLHNSGAGQLAPALHRALGGLRRFDLSRVPDRLRGELYRTHLRYIMRLRQAADPAPVALAELVAGPGVLAPEHVREGDWYVVTYRDRGRRQTPQQPVADRDMVVAALGLSSDMDGPSHRARVLDVTPLAVADPELHLLLQALHFPQANPEPLPNSQEQSHPESGAPRVTMVGDGHLAAVDGETRTSLTGFSPFKAVLSPARLAAQLGAGEKARSATTAVQPATITQQPGNPMACQPGALRPFVGVNMVGAGNNTALYGRNGVVAYVDYGAPLPSNQNTAPVGGGLPCVCGDPMMILSHWDYDHYAMARQVNDAWRRRWIAPQQLMGSVSARELYARLLIEAPHGGALALWPASVGSPPAHLELPFGFIERGVGAPVNDDCLAVHVRLVDDPAKPAAPAALAVFPPRPIPLPVAAPTATSRQAIIVDNGLQGSWLSNELVPTFKGLPAALPISSGLLATPLLLPAPGKLARLTPTDAKVGGAIRARWIPPAGLPSTGINGGNHIPTLPNGRPWPGGWAISAHDFVRLGGCIMDFPRNRAGSTVDNLICVSPTPGTIWALTSKPPGHRLPAAATLLPATQPNQWQPVWGSGGWAVMLPADGAAALSPLPAGPLALTPATGVAPMSEGESYVLLPGDAGFQYLPSMQARVAASTAGKALPAIVGLLATHHGSDSWIPDKKPKRVLALQHIPKGKTAKIVYSYGTRISGKNRGAHCYISNTKGHPRPAAIRAYRAAGWGRHQLPGPWTFNRLNSAPHDFESKQPFNPLRLAAGTAPPAANMAGHHNGNVALGAAGTSQSPPVLKTCPHCGQQRTYYF